MQIKKPVFFLVFMAFLTLAMPSCTFKLDGASIPPEMKTLNVNYFENNALLVVATLSQQFTEQLKQQIRSQTRLSITRSEDADGSFSGSIVGYTVAPVSVSTTNNPNQAPLANASRLTITVAVKYTNKANPKLNFEQQFSRYADFTGDLASKEQGLIADINRQLTEDIFNKAFADW